MNAPVLGFSDFNKELFLTTDTSAIALGAILKQGRDAEGRRAYIMPQPTT